MRRVRVAVIGACLAIAVASFAYFPAKITAASGDANAGNAAIRYTGPSALVSALQSGRARPTALAGADFDFDGAPDLVIGYATSAGGAVAILRGNRDAFAPRDPNLYRAASLGQMPPTFVSVAMAFAVPETPDFLVTGDFNRDGHEDVLVGTKGGGLYLVAGDGRGNLLPAQPVALPGKLSALAATSAGHVAVGTNGPDGSRLVVLAPSREGLLSSVTYALPAPATSVAWGALGGGTGADLAVSSGKSVDVIYNALSPQAERATMNFRFQVKALALGDFIWDRNATTEMAILGDDGVVRILRHGKLNTRPLTAAAIAARSAMPARRTPTGSWTAAKRIVVAASSSLGVTASSTAEFPRLAVSSNHELMILDGVRNQVSILPRFGKPSRPAVTFPVSGSPLAVYGTPSKLEGSRDLVVLTSERLAPLVISSKSVVVSVNTTVDADPQGACTNPSILPNDLHGSISLRTAVCAADNYGAMGHVTINVPTGTYQLTSLDTGELQVGLVSDSDISIVGTGVTTNTVIQQTDGMNRVFNFDPFMAGNVVAAISNVTVTGGTATSLGGGGMLAGFIGDSYTITNSVFTNNQSSGVGASGGGIDLRGGSLKITNCTITSNTAQGNAGGGIAITSGTGSPGDVSLFNSLVSANLATGGSPGQGGGLFVDIDPSSSANISGSTVTLNSAGSDGEGGGIFNEAGPLSIVDSRVVGNQAGDASGIYTLNFDATATDNWWGCNDGPGATGCDSVDGFNGQVTVNPWLVLSLSARRNRVKPGQTSALTADLTHNSNGAGGFSVPNGTPIIFSAEPGSVRPSQTILNNGLAASTYTAGTKAGAGQASATVDNQTVSAPIDVVQAPGFTNADHTTFRAGKAGQFQVTTAGFPPPALVEHGSLPDGVTFEDNGNGTGTLAGAPARGTGGVHKIVFAAQNEVPPSAHQDFTLTIDAQPLIYSANSTNFQVGSDGSFTVKTSGYPTPTITESGTLPAGVSFTDNHNGTGSLTGTPAVGTANNYPIEFIAANGVRPNAVQHFTLGVDQSPAITSPNHANFQVGATGSFTVTTTGFPTPTITETGALPAGVSFKDNQNGTATLAGTPAAAGVFGIAVSASNSAGNTEQGFTLTVQKANSSTVLSSSPNPSDLNQSVVFSAQVSAKGAGAPTGEVKFMDGSEELGSANLDASGVAKLTVASLTSGTHSMTAAYAGNGNYESSTSLDMRQVVMGEEGFHLSADPSKLTLSAGSAGKFTITTTGQNGFNSAVSLACKAASLPPGASCQFSPASVTPWPKPVTSTLTITTTAEEALLRSPWERHRPMILYAFGLAMPSLVMSTLGLGGWSRRKLLWFCMLCILIGGCVLLSACGNGGTNTSTGNTGGGNPVTGTYDVVVTGTSTTMTQTTTITMNVQ